MQPSRLNSCAVSNRDGNKWAKLVLYRLATHHNRSAWGGRLPNNFTPDNIYSQPVLINMGHLFQTGGLPHVGGVNAPTVDANYPTVPLSDITDTFGIEF